MRIREKLKNLMHLQNRKINYIQNLKLFGMKEDH
ncbi:hypothetical protein pb186bvf_000797 [Paramecium bursaria]